MEKRIGIRPLRFSDALDVYENVKDKDIVRWTMTIPHPYPKDGALKFIRKSRHNMRKGKSYTFGITLSDNKKRAGKVIGVVGLMNVDWAEKNAEIGYWLGKRYWNKGLMTEGVELILTYGFKELRLHRIYATLFDKNIGSKKTLEKAGFKLEGKMRHARYRYGKWHNVLIYGILSSEFKFV